MKNAILFLFAFFLCASSEAQKLQTGIWKGALKNSAGLELPFNFIVKDTAGRQAIDIINGSERFPVTDLSFKGDSVFIRMPLFDSEFRLAKAGNNVLNGSWIKHVGERDVAMPFTAIAGEGWRFFKHPEKPSFNIGGRWSAIFGEGAHRDTTVGEFKQEGGRITGTFLTTTGDYRFLEGTVTGDKLYLSCFDGGHAYLFTATIKDDHTIDNGKLYSGLTGTDTWTAVKDPNAKLPDPFALTALKPGYKKLQFTFPDLNGKKVSLSDARFKNKVVIVEMMGSWCPNCMDEAGFMVNYYKKYHPRGVEVVALAYERTTGFNRSKASLLREKEHFNIQYPILVTGFTPGRGEPSKSLPMLSNFMGFPTTIIIDKKGDVREIYTGFSGPGTGNYYTEFVNQFEKITDDLLAE